MKNLEALKKWIDTIIKLGPFVIVFEVIIGAMMAIASSQIKAIDPLWSGVLIFSIIVFIAINIFKYFNEKNFPKLLIENIENEINEDTLSKSFARKSLINDAIASTLIGLNDQTCKLTNKAVPNYATEEEISNRMCEKDIEDGVLNLLRPLIMRIKS
jgi:Na+(H+)/acetate symporter ActP